MKVNYTVRTAAGIVNKTANEVVYVKRNGCNLFYQFAAGGCRHNCKAVDCEVLDSYGVVYSGSKIEVDFRNVITF